MTDQVREQVRERYAAAATAVSSKGENPLAVVDAAQCCVGDVEVDAAFGSTLYGADEQGELPAEAVAASLGCGNPMAVADLRAGEKVLDLGSGGGIDVLLSAKRVGPTGFAFGVDMTDEMLDLARANAAKAGATNVEFLRAPSRRSRFPTPASTSLSPTASSTSPPTSRPCSRRCSVY